MPASRCRLRRSKKSLLIVVIFLICCMLSIYNILTAKSASFNAFQYLQTESVPRFSLSLSTTTHLSAIHNSTAKYKELSTTERTNDINAMFNITPFDTTFKGWKLGEKPFCNDKFIGYAKQFAQLRNVIIEPAKNSNTRGGEEIKDVKNQPEQLEYLKIERGYFSLDCSQAKLLAYTFQKGTPNLGWLWSLVTRTYKYNLTSLELVNTTVIAVQRYEYVNIYHTMTDLYNTFLMMLFFQIKPKNVKILWMDAHPKGSLDSVWETLFGPTIRATHIKVPTLYERMIWSINGYESFINQHSTPSVPYIEEFRKFVLHQFQVGIPETINCKLLRVLVIFRHDYLAHPRNMKGTVQRKLKNEQELVKAIQLINCTVTGAQLDVLSFKEQLKYIANTDILIGMHGAGLTMALFLPPGSTVIELIPSYASANNRHFRSIARWRHLQYFNYQNKNKSNEFPNYQTYIDPRAVKDLIKNAKHGMCVQ